MKISIEDKLFIQAVAETCASIRQEQGYDCPTHFAEDKYLDTGAYTRIERGHNMTLVSAKKLVPHYNKSLHEFLALVDKRFNELKIQSNFENK